MLDKLTDEIPYESSAGWVGGGYLFMDLVSAAWSLALLEQSQLPGPSPSITRVLCSIPKSIAY